MGDFGAASEAFGSAIDSGAVAVEDPPGASPTPTPEPAPEAPEPAPAAEQTPPAGPVDDDDDGDKGPVPWGEHRKARKEAERYRTELRAYEEAFSAWDPDDAKVLLAAVGGAAKLIQAGRADEAASLFQDLAKAVGPEVAAAVQEAAEEKADEDSDADELLTRADLERYLAEQQSRQVYEQGVQRELQSIHQYAVDHGIDPTSEEWVEILALADRLHDGDVAAAHEQLKARQQRIIDAYLQGKVGASDQFPAVTGQGQSPTPSHSQPKSVADASDAARAWLDKI